MQRISSIIAGGFSEENVNCVVCIDVKDMESKYMMVQSGNISGESPESIMRELSDIFDKPKEDIIVTVFQLCGGMNGAKL